MSEYLSFINEHKWMILGGAALGIVFRTQLAGISEKIQGHIFDSKAAELVFRPKPLDGVSDGRTLGQIRTERDGSQLKMTNRGRAVGQNIATDPSLSITEGPIPMGATFDPSMDTTLWEGKFTDGALKYTVASFGSNYSGSAIGVQ